jgi:hypothetical protein
MQSACLKRAKSGLGRWQRINPIDLEILFTRAIRVQRRSVPHRLRADARKAGGRSGTFDVRSFPNNGAKADIASDLELWPRQAAHSLFTIR